MSDISVAPISAAPATYASSASPRTTGPTGPGGFRAVLKDTLGGVVSEPEPPAEESESDPLTSPTVGTPLCMFLPSVVASQSQPSESTGTDATSGGGAGSAESVAAAFASMTASDAPILTTAEAAAASDTTGDAVRAKGALAEGAGTKRTMKTANEAGQQSSATPAREAAPAGLHLKPEVAATAAPTLEREFPGAAGVAPEKDPFSPATRKMMESLNATLAPSAPAVEAPRPGAFEKRPIAAAPATVDATVPAAALASRQEAAASAQSMPHLRAVPVSPTRSGAASRENSGDDLRATVAPASGSFATTAREAVRSGSGTLSQRTTAAERPRTARATSPYETTSYRVTQDQAFAEKALAQETSAAVEQPAQPAPTAPMATFATQAESAVAASRAVDQVAEGLALNLRAGKTEATITLRPAALGDVKVQILSGSDGLIVRISAEHEAVGDLLRARVGELREALAGRQLAVSELHVLHNPPAVQNAFTEQQQRSTWQEQRRAHQQEDAPAEQGSEQRGEQPDEDE